MPSALQFQTVPRLDARYWLAITLASIFGANLGDFVSHNLHMGHFRGLPWIAAAFILIAIGGVLGRMRWEGWYWLAIVAMRTAATNLADLATHDGALATVPVCAVLAVALVGILATRRSIPTPGVPRADALYWLAMLTAGTLGTAAGDGIADAITLPAATILTALLVAGALALRTRPVAPIATYWLAIVAIRTFGTNAGDLIAHQWTLAVTTPLTGLVLLALLTLYRPHHSRRVGFSPPTQAPDFTSTTPPIES